MRGWLLVLVAAGCAGKDGDSDSECRQDTGDTAASDCGGTDTEEDPGAPGTATVTPTPGTPYTFTAADVYGGWNATDWGFTLLGTDPTNALSFGVAGAPGTGTYALLTPDDDSFSTFTDLATFGLQGGAFTSTTGTLTVTRWEETTAVTDRAFLADGSFDVSYVNAETPAVALHLVGTFEDITLVGE